MNTKIRWFCLLFLCSFFISVSFASELLDKGIEQYKAGNYKSAIDFFTQVLSTDIQNEKAKKYLEKSADKMLEPERKAIEKERVQFMKEAQKALKEQQKWNAKIEKEIKPLLNIAKKYFKKKWYLTSTDKFTEILLKYPKYQSARDYYEKIKRDMGDTTVEQTTDLEKLSYAKGYVSYYEQKLPDAVNEWEKTLQINPKREELDNYIKNVKEKLKDAGQLAREKEIEERVKRLFGEGVNNFDIKRWVGCIKKMENVQQICKDDPFPKSLEWHGKAQEYISKAVEELSKLAAKEPAVKPAYSTPVEGKDEIDTAGAEKKYSEGLVLYAQGKLFDAVQKWEVAVRMNPGNEKATRALEKAKKELQLQKR